MTLTMTSHAERGKRSSGVERSGFLLPRARFAPASLVRAEGHNKPALDFFFGGKKKKSKAPCFPNFKVDTILQAMISALLVSSQSSYSRCALVSLKGLFEALINR